jgi:hypothetical protein
MFNIALGQITQKMKRIFILLSLIFVVLQVAANEDMVVIRNLFYNATISADSADVLAKKLQTITADSKAELIGYKAMSKLMICYHSYNPYTKYKNFICGKELLEQAIKKDPDNIELRFLRLTVQLNVPPFLSYSNNIMEDKTMIFNGVKNIKDKDLFSRIYRYTLNAKKISVTEKEKMKEALIQNKYINNQL